jgi:hypothetical protein
MTVKISKKSPLTWLYGAGIVLLAAAAWIWCFKVSIAPERVFWTTINRGLTAHGITIQAEQDSNGTHVKQTIRSSLGGDNLSQTITTLSQAGTKVTNETLGTPDADYTRYRSFKTDQKRADGGKLNFSKVLNVWAKGQQGSAQFFQQAVFGASLPIGGMGVPIGHLSPENRSKLVKQVRDDVVYQVDFKKVKKAHVHGRLQYTYTASVQTVAYVAMMKQFSQSIGLHGLDQLDPADYKGQKPFTLQITVDARAQQVVSIFSPDSKAKQTYLNYDVPVRVEVPKKTISSAELQKRLSNLQ